MEALQQRFLELERTISSFIEMNNEKLVTLGSKVDSLANEATSAKVKTQNQKVISL